MLAIFHIMRANELLQLNLSSDCLVQLVDDPPPGAKDQSPRIRYVLRLLPKGERTETRHNYGIGKESVHLIEKTAHMLCEHYHLQPGETLPRVPFNPGHQRSHRFPSAPYLFQYTGKHLDDHTITACMRFLLHGLVFQTSTGKPVVLKAHLLRHAFATFAVQIEGVPIDLVAEWCFWHCNQCPLNIHEVGQMALLRVWGTLPACCKEQVWDMNSIGHIP